MVELRRAWRRKGGVMTDSGTSSTTSPVGTGSLTAPPPLTASLDRMLISAPSPRPSRPPSLPSPCRDLPGLEEHCPGSQEPPAAADPERHHEGRHGGVQQGLA